MDDEVRPVRLSRDPRLIREKIHFKAPPNPDDDFPSPDDPEWCNCGRKWPCPILVVYEANEKGLTANGVVYAHDPAQSGEFIWRCCCGTLNDYKVGETQFCKGCRFENPVVEAVYSIDHAKHWPTNLRKP